MFNVNSKTDSLVYRMWSKKPQKLTKKEENQKTYENKKSVSSLKSTKEIHWVWLQLSGTIR